MTRQDILAVCVMMVLLLACLALAVLIGDGLPIQ
jgi:hypothetical protein